MNTQGPDQATLGKLIALGHCADDAPQLGDMIGSLRGNSYVSAIHPFLEFEWLRELLWVDACAVVRAVTRLEAKRLTKSGGSASAIKNAYRTMEDRDRVAAMELAAWVVDHSDNDYIPFPMRKIRYTFEGIKRQSSSWAQCREELDRWCSGEWVRQRRVAEEIVKQKPESDRRQQIQRAVAARLNAERVQRQQARALGREKLLAELRGLPVMETLEHIAWDDTRSLAYYPSDLAVCTAQDVEQLDAVTKARLIVRLRERRKGPWHKLAKRLGVTP